MTTVNIIDVHHSTVAELRATENQYGGITRTAIRTATTTVSLTNAETLSASWVYTYDSSYDREAQRINIYRIKAEVGKLNTAMSSALR